MADATAASSSSDIIADIVRLIAPSDREGYFAKLAHELRGHELPDDELRRVAVNVWHKFLKDGWPGG